MNSTSDSVCGKTFRHAKSCESTFNWLDTPSNLVVCNDLE